MRGYGPRIIGDIAQEYVLGEVDFQQMRLGQITLKQALPDDVAFGWRQVQNRWPIVGLHRNIGERGQNPKIGLFDDQMQLSGPHPTQGRDPGQHVARLHAKQIKAPCGAILVNQPVAPGLRDPQHPHFHPPDQQQHQDGRARHRQRDFLPDKTDDDQRGQRQSIAQHLKFKDQAQITCDADLPFRPDRHTPEKLAWQLAHLQDGRIAQGVMGQDQHGMQPNANLPKGEGLCIALAGAALEYAQTDPKETVMPITAAEVALPVTDLRAEMPFFIDRLGFQLDEIYPADDPAVAVISGHGLRLRLDRHAPKGTVHLRLRVTDKTLADMISPAGHVIKIVAANPALTIPQTQHRFLVRHMIDSDSWVIGRAGMQYRDLIPDRLGGSIIASHIRIPDGGPVPDMVHYHVVGFQLIFCLKGWVRLVYEDQGEPFILAAGNCVIQPPQIRHRVLEASDNVEVLEIGVPAEHLTAIDHVMPLPNGILNPDREWDGTRFVHFLTGQTAWHPWRIPGWEAQDTGIGKATAGVAGVHVVRPVAGVDPVWSAHDTDILFTFVKEGKLTLEAEGEAPHPLIAGDAFVIPPHLRTCYRSPSADCVLIETALGAGFNTTF